MRSLTSRARSPRLLLALLLPVPLALAAAASNHVQQAITHVAAETETVTSEPSPPSPTPPTPTSMPQAAVITESRAVRSDAPPAITVAATTPHGIPTVALAAYQRAATVLASADPQCNLRWELLAAIGRVETDHGRHGGSDLDENGVARPAIHGVPLDGKRGTRAIPDTDAGQHDRDERWDRAVGPMQFIPTTWSVVGVDADGDGVRNPQDIDDATLAAAVHLCTGPGDLSKEPTLREAVMRYNQDRAYVRLVIALAAAYATQDPAVVRLAELSIGEVLARKEAAPDKPGGKAAATTKGQQAGSGNGEEQRDGASPSGTNDDRGDRTRADEPAEPSPTEPSPTQPSPTEEAPTEEAPTEETPTKGTPTKGTPTEDSDACTGASEEPTTDPTDESTAGSTTSPTTEPTEEPADDPTTQPTTPCTGETTTEATGG